MRATRGISFIFSILCLLGFLGTGAVSQARVTRLSDLVKDASVAKIPSNVLDQLFPEATPVSTPEATPSATPEGTPVATPVATPSAEPTESPDVPEAEGYQLDANDHLAVVTSDGLKLNLNGLVLETMPGYSVLRFEMNPVNGAPATPFYLSVYAKAEGKFDIRVANYDSADYAATLKVSGVMGEKSYDLKPNSRLLFAAQYLEGILFDGDQNPGAGVNPSHYVEMDSEAKTILAGVGGKIVLESRPVPGSYTPPPPPVPSSPSFPPGPSGGNPSTSNPPGGPLDDGSNIPAGFNGGLGGGGMLSCGLNLGGIPSNALMGGGIFFLSLAVNLALRLRGRSK